VDAQVARAKREAGITQAWPTRERLLVAVGPSPLSANLIRSAYRMATRLQARWIGLAVETPAVLRLSGEERARMEENLTLAERLGAETLVVSGESVADSIIQVANQRNVTRIIVGKADRPSWRDRLRPSLSEALIRRSGGIDVLVTRGEAEAPRPRPRGAAPRPLPVREYLWTLALIAAVIGIGLAARPVLDQVDVAMLYLLAILLVASRFSRGPSLLASLGSVAAFDFFFVTPYFTFAIADVRYAVTFLVLLATGLVVSSLTLRIRRQAEASREREQRITLLHNLTRSFAYRRGVRDIATTAVSHMEVLYGVPAALFLPDSGDGCPFRPAVSIRSRIPSTNARWPGGCSSTGGPRDTPPTPCRSPRACTCP
jgi:two-component system sensor histidine kinase KdpD